MHVKLQFQFFYLIKDKNSIYKKLKSQIIVIFWRAQLYLSFFFLPPFSLINDYFLGKLGHFSLDFSTLPTNLEADCALCFPSHLFICLSA